MSGIMLTRAQRRQMQKMADKIDRITQADRLFFERFPHREIRVRLARQAEIEQQAILDGKPPNIPQGYHVCHHPQCLSGQPTAIVCARPARVLNRVSEDKLGRGSGKRQATPKVREIEAQMRKMAEEWT